MLQQKGYLQMHTESILVTKEPWLYESALDLRKVSYDFNYAKNIFLQDNTWEDERKKHQNTTIDGLHIFTLLATGA